MRVTNVYSVRDIEVDNLGTTPIHGWLNRLLHSRKYLTPNATQMQQIAYERGNNSGQTVMPGTGYASKLQSEQARGTRSMALYPVVRDVPSVMQPFPVGSPVGLPHDMVKRRDFNPPRNTPVGRTQDFAPGDQRYQMLHSTTGQRSHNFAANGLAATAMSVDYRGAPWRVPMIRKAGMSLMAGASQWASKQNWSGAKFARDCLVLPPPTGPKPGAQARSVSGVLGRVQGGGRNHIPAVFGPKEVR